VRAVAINETALMTMTKRRTVLIFVVANISTLGWLLFFWAGREAVVATIASLAIVNFAVFFGLKMAAQGREGSAAGGRRKKLFSAAIVIAWIAMAYWAISALRH